jgi:TolA-binding protein
MPVQVLKRAVAGALTLLCAAAGPALAASQGRPEQEIAVARLFEHAGRLLQEGRQELALDEYRRLADGYPQSDLADDALLAIAAQIYPVAGVEGLGRRSGVELEQAFRLFDRVRRDHPRGNAAPAALLRMALLRLEPRGPRYDPEEARALLRSLCEGYPDSEWADEGRLALAYVGRLSGAAARVVAELQPFYEGLAASPLAPLAQLWRGDAFEALGRRARALETYQTLRERAPRSPEAGWAQARALLLVRRTLAAGGAAGLMEDPAATAPLLQARAVTALIATPQGWNWVLEEEGRVLTRLDPRGGLLERRQLEAPAAIALDGFGQIAIVENGRLRVGKSSWSLAVTAAGEPSAGDRAGESPAAPPARTVGSSGAPGGVAFAPSVAPLPRLDGSWWFVDERGRSVLEFDGELKFRRTVWSLVGGSISRARMGARDTAWLLDVRGGRLVRLGAAAEARVIDLAAAPAALRKPADLAVDPLGAAWILDAGRSGAAVFSPEGEYEGFVPFAPSFAKADPRVFDIDAGGALLVFDGRGKRLARLVDAAPPVPSSGRLERGGAAGRGEEEQR